MWTTVLSYPPVNMCTVTATLAAGDLTKPARHLVPWLTFVAFDFETATGSRDSACSVAAVRVVDGLVRGTFHSLIRPPGNEYELRNTWVHGLTADDTADAPDMAAVWEQMRTFIAGHTLVAHNAAFDTSVLRASLDRYGLPVTSHPVACTLHMARSAIRGLWSYRLPVLCENLGIELTHHDPRSDAAAAAELAVRMVVATSNSYIDEAVAQLRCRMGAISPHPHENHACSPAGHTVHYPGPVEEPRPGVPGHPLYGKRVVFTGDLLCGTRNQVSQQAHDRGALVSQKVTDRTHYLVAGQQIPDRVGNHDNISSKVRKAWELADANCPVQVIDETQFLELLHTPA